MCANTRRGGTSCAIESRRSIHAEITTALLTGQLTIHAANVERVEACDGKVRVHLNGEKHLDGDLVINATGPQTRFTATRSVLLQSLLRRGLVSPDDMDLGVRIDADHTVIAGDGNRSELLLALGPLLRGTYWETIAVPELRGQARRVAETILEQDPTIGRGAGHDGIHDLMRIVLPTLAAHRTKP